VLSVERLCKFVHMMLLSNTGTSQGLSQTFPLLEGEELAV